MKFTTNGLVIKEQTVGESDKLVTLLTSDYGICKAFVRRAKQMKSSLSSATSLFAYSTLTLYKTKDAYIVDTAAPIEIFFDLRKNIEALSLAQYFAQIAFEMAGSEQPCEDILKLTLNSLHLLCQGKKDSGIIKAVYEFRAVSLGGYMPAVLACDNCGIYETDIMYFDSLDGRLYCKNCKKEKTIEINKDVVTAIRYICLSEASKIFSFTLSEENVKLLNFASEAYVKSKVQHQLTALDFYKSLF